MLIHLAQRLAHLPDRAIIAIDGVDGAGKTTFADQLGPMIGREGRRVLRASVDGFHHPRARRYARGKSDPLGFFLDSYDYEALKTGLLAPFQQGQETVETARFDHRTDEATTQRADVPPSAILVLDGIFLHRDELCPFWDYSIFLDIPFEMSFARLAKRDGFDPDPFAASNSRYLKGQMIYLNTCTPKDRASLVLKGAIAPDAAR